MPHISKPPATLLIGSPGTGKTTAIITYLKAGLEVFVLITDPGGEEALIDAAIANNLPLDKLHWHYVPSAAHSWKMAATIFQRVHQMSYESLGALKGGLHKDQFGQFLKVMESLADFKCDRTGESYGAVDSWDASRVLVIDSITGINKMAQRLVVGAKPTLHQGEWGTAMQVEEQFIDLLTANIRCFLLCIGHIEKSMDEMRGRPIISASFLGNKLAPKIPSLFSDVVLARRDGKKFFWDTSSTDVDLKARTLPLSNDLKPDFQQVVDGWKKREAAIQKKLQEAPVKQTT